MEVLDWIARQQWCSGQVTLLFRALPQAIMRAATVCKHRDMTRSAPQVILYGMSYEAGAALFTLAAGHPAVKGGVLMYPFWDLYTDISCPGGVPQASFIRTWSRLSLGLDANNVGSLALLLKVFFRSAAEPLAPREGDEIALNRSLLQQLSARLGSAQRYTFERVLLWNGHMVCAVGCSP